VSADRRGVNRKLTWEGPSDYVCHEVGQASGASAELVPGKTYDLPGELAESLLRSSPYWAEDGKKEKSK
jgi:hypothetical protein